MTKIVFIHAGYGEESILPMERILTRCGYAVTVTDISYEEFELSKIINAFCFEKKCIYIIDECSLGNFARELYMFLVRNTTGAILCGCVECKKRRYIWGESDFHILNKIFLMADQMPST